MKAFRSDLYLTVSERVPKKSNYVTAFLFSLLSDNAVKNFLFFAVRKDAAEAAISERWKTHAEGRP